MSWGLLTTGIVALAVLLLFRCFERNNVSSREVSVIAVLCALSALGRAPTTGFLCVQPTMFLVIISGFVFNMRTGFIVGALTPFISNFFMGQGPWTPWQMLTWGLMGFSAGWLKLLCPGVCRTGLIVFNICWGYIYGWIMNVWFWSCFIDPLSWQSFLATCAASLGFDTVRALANGLFFSLLGPGVMKILLRFHQKLKVFYEL
jgi:energy-coupling factor transport system substrate-specific component